MKPCRIVGGKPYACRTCKFVMNPELREVPQSSLGAKAHLVIVCLHHSPPFEFNWPADLDLEPFCGDYDATEGTASATK